MNGSSNETPEVDLTSDGAVLNRGTINPTQVVVSSLAVWQGVIPAPGTKPSSNGMEVSGTDTLSTEVTDKSKDANASGTKNGPVDLTASKNKSFSNVVLNRSSNKEDAVMTNMESLKSKERSVNDNKSGSNGPEDAPATNSVSNKDGVVQGGDVVMGACLCPHKPVQNVGISDIDDMSLVGKAVNHLGNNTVLNAGRSTQDTLSALKKITPVWSITQHKHRSAASVSIPSTIWKKTQTIQRFECHSKCQR